MHITLLVPPRAIGILSMVKSVAKKHNWIKNTGLSKDEHFGTVIHSSRNYT